jgi:rubredoxin
MSRVKCTKCGFEANPGLIARHHNENCKEIDWNDVREYYNTNRCSFRELGRKYNIDRRVIQKRLSI